MGLFLIISDHRSAINPLSKDRLGALLNKLSWLFNKSLNSLTELQ